MAQSIPNESKLTNLQLELLKSLKYMVSEKQISEIRSLLSFYFERQLNLAIDKAENERNYSAQVYESWLNNGNENEIPDP
ncbi:MAG: hypothetical protein HZB42_05095 [Sphingobacteriales bacterium]|nr:hypothetical protein [Sphingobacteriales bacterium]